MAPSIPQTTRPTVPELHALMGELLDLIPEADTWTVGRQADGCVGIDTSILSHTADRSRLDDLGVLLGGEIHPVGSPYQVSIGTLRMHRLTATWRGVRVTVTAHVTEPTELDALRARVAELEAAEAAQGGAA